MGELDIGLELLWQCLGLVLQIEAFLGDGDDEVAGVTLVAVSTNECLLFEGAQHRTKGARIEGKQPPNLLATELTVLPNDEHGEVLGVGEIELLKKRCEGANGFLGARIEQKAEMMVKC